ESPLFAANAANAVADEYVDYSFETKHSATTKAKDFLEDELAKQQQKLERSEQELVKYGREHGILLPSESNNATLQKLAELNTEVTKVDAQLLANPYPAIKNATAETFPDTLKTNVMRDLEGRRSSLEQKLATVTAQFGPKWPALVTLNQELDEVRKQLT